MTPPGLNRLPKEEVPEGNISTLLHFKLVLNSGWGVPRTVTAALVGRG